MSLTTYIRPVQDLEVGDRFEWNGRRRIVRDRPYEDDGRVVLWLLAEDWRYDEEALGFLVGTIVEVES